MTNAGDKKRSTTDVIGSFLEQAKLDRVALEERGKSDEQIAAGLAAAGVTTQQVDALFERQMKALLRHAPRVPWGVRLKYVGVGMVIGIGVTLGIVAIYGPPPHSQPPVERVDAGYADVALVAAPRPTPAEQREQARRACAVANWELCLRRLDSAREDDPAGDDTHEIQNMRAVAGKYLALERDR